jgi:5-formyltetrahydrofolate cyclo-ligase
VKSHELKRAKRDVRRDVLAARDAIEPAQRSQAAMAVADRVLELSELATAETVTAFWAFGSELPLDALIERLTARGIVVGLPVIVGNDIVFRSFTPGDPTAPTAFGAREPTDGRAIETDRVDVVITPGVAFDRRGRRIGYGGGFYDRFLATARADAVRVGVGYDLQIVEGDLPAGAFDLRVHVIVTPTETIRCAPGS